MSFMSTSKRGHIVPWEHFWILLHFNWLIYSLCYHIMLQQNHGKREPSQASQENSCCVPAHGPMIRSQKAWKGQWHVLIENTTCVKVTASATFILAMLTVSVVIIVLIQWLYWHYWHKNILILIINFLKKNTVLSGPSIVQWVLITKWLLQGQHRLWNYQAKQDNLHRGTYILPVFKKKKHRNLTKKQMWSRSKIYLS